MPRGADSTPESSALGRRIAEGMRGKGRPKILAQFVGGMAAGAAAPFELLRNRLRERRGD
jgi:hypothetical protein